MIDISKINKLIAKCYQINKIEDLVYDVLNQICKDFNCANNLIIFPRDSKGNIIAYSPNRNLFYNEYANIWLPKAYPTYLSRPVNQINRLQEILKEKEFIKKNPIIDELVATFLKPNKIKNALLYHGRADVKNGDNNLFYLQAYNDKANIQHEYEQIILYHLIQLAERIFRKENFMSNFSNREIEIASLVLEGFSNPDIGKILGISVNTVKTIIGNLFNKLTSNSRQELVAKLLINNFDNIQFNYNSGKLIYQKEDTYKKSNQIIISL